MEARGHDLIARLELLERAGDPALTALTRLAAYVTGAPAAAVHVLDRNAQHRVAAVGAPLGSHPREDAMCRLVVDGEQRIVCANAAADERFSFSSFVAGPAPVRFYASMPLRTSNGAVIGSLCSWDTERRILTPEQVARLEDLAGEAVARIELTRLASELGHAATHDPLTGALNRLLLDDRLGQAFARRMRNGGEVLVALADVDRFKQINDTLGHDAGDELLVGVARRLHEATRASDTVARLGGDEFAVVAEVADEASAEPLVERLRAGLTAPLTYAGAERPLSVSLGAAFAAPGESVREALARADAAMYGAKLGR